MFSQKRETIGIRPRREPQAIRRTRPAGIPAGRSHCSFVRPINEELMIARHMLALLSTHRTASSSRTRNFLRRAFAR